MRLYRPAIEEDEWVALRLGISRRTARWLIWLKWRKQRGTLGGALDGAIRS